MTTEIKILAIETASEACSAVLLISDEKGNQTLYEQIELTPRQHAKKILSMLDKVLEEGDTVLADIDAIAFSRGPGAFTGLRIAAGVAQGVALSVDKPVVPVSTLEALALQACDVIKDDKNKYKNTIFAAALDARMGEVYWGLFTQGQGKIALLGEEQVSKPEEMLQSMQKTTEQLDDYYVYAIGAGWDVYVDIFFDDISPTSPPANITHLKMMAPTASAIAKLALISFKNNEIVTPEDAQPVYIRNNVAKKSQKAQ